MDNPPAAVGRAGQPPPGPDLAHGVLAAARSRAAQPGAAPGRRPGRSTRIGSPRRRRGWSGPGPDHRDPQPLGRLLSLVSAQQGWAPRLASRSVFDLWPELVGAEIAEHTTPMSLRDGELTVQASSTAWATQLRLLQRQLLLRLAARLGNGVVRRLRVHGPSGPSWRHGLRTVPGRGPRDTYG